MDPSLRRLLFAGTVVLSVLIGFMAGVWFERNQSEPDGSTVGAPTSSPTGSVTIPVGSQTTQAGPVPTFVGPPITADGAILRVGDQPVVPAAETAPCQALFTPGRLGTCGYVDMAGGRVAWVVEHVPGTFGDAFTVRILTFVPASGGWVERLAATDPQGEAWTGANVVAADLTGDGLAEVMAGFRFRNAARTLGYDVVLYPAGDVPRVAAHRGGLDQGSVALGAGSLEEYAGLYPGGEPPCCPPSYRHDTIRYTEGLFRVVAETEVPTGQVPPSQL